MIKIRGLVDEDFVNYKKPAMFIAFPYCTFKCDKECGYSVCQNSSLVTNSEIINIDEQIIIDRYIKNPITHSIVISGLEPFDSFNQLLLFIEEFRKVSDDDIVIYTGYTEREVYDLIYLSPLLKYKNIIIKFGRYIPNSENKYDEILGVTLASQNQYAKRVTEYEH